MIMNMTDAITPPNVTRVVVVTGDGAHEFRSGEWFAVLQDGGRTLKMFAVDEGLAVGDLIAAVQRENAARGQDS